MQYKAQSNGLAFPAKMGRARDYLRDLAADCGAEKEHLLPTSLHEKTEVLTLAIPLEVLLDLCGSLLSAHALYFVRDTIGFLGFEA